ncbi:Bacteroides conjugative transposon TraM protein [Pedobacter suwonensis]|uniref:Bacteroides conjugative transposon TraM protein n=1 Tax=Pedobacter suwonensis TaxID=332999 RepID=A0A1I0TT37_9SPHI|nr:conjugative transposon protein TraM [Pedobacter suwonensis]SFA54955.1 Bacteroides conjugative transposon TraM protein [Pedobacter suwonensis]
MKINFKKPRYIIPLISIPFLCLFFYVYQQSASKKQSGNLKEDMNGNLTEISDQVRERGLSDKLEAYKNSYKEADGYSAIKTVSEEQLPQATMASSYSDREKQKLDSIEESIKRQAYMPRQLENKSYPVYSAGRSEYSVGGKPEDRAVAQALASLAEARSREKPSPNNISKETDPMDLFKKQMAYVDSLQKVNDPDHIARQKEKMIAVAGSAKEERTLQVSKISAPTTEFNTLTAFENRPMITAIIDEDITGYSGSRIRLRLLDQVYAGKSLLPKGTDLYARISGFSEQRVQLEISSVICSGKILPIKLLVYDTDGLPGLYVPASAFREFSKGLGSSPVQGFNTMGSSQNQNEFVMSTVDKLFQSTSSAIANLVRKNRAKLKFNNQVFLVDPHDLQEKN